MLGLPYDWRLHNDDDPVTNMIPKVVRSLAMFSNKKVTIVGHSMGNFRALNAIYNMDKSFKERYVKRYISIAPPFMGVTKAIFQMICGERHLDYDLFFGLKLGISPNGFAKLFSSLESIYQLLPNNALRKNKNEAWVKAIRRRIRYEKEVHRGRRNRQRDRN